MTLACAAACCLRACALALLLWCAACSSLPTPLTSGPPSIADQDVYVIRRSWHVDVGLARKDLRPPLTAVAAGLPGARFVLFGFGDRRYLLHGANLAAAIWPGPGIVLVTGVHGSLEDAFAPADVVSLKLTPAQMAALQNFLLATLQGSEETLSPVARGPYRDSAYFESNPRYSGLHTCNTWAAEALGSAGVPVHSRGVVFAWQLWRQVSRLATLKHAPVARRRAGQPPERTSGASHDAPARGSG
jgi:Protein of unknown function (DUF2459)